VLLEVATAAREGRRLGRPLLGRLAASMPAPTTPWTRPTRDAFVELLSAGSGAIRIIESLDQVGVWERFVPEWGGVRTRAQRTTHHRYTVDRHLLETVAVASTYLDRVARGDLLVVAALLHDLGKGRGGDHTAVGVELAERIAPRMGFDADDTTVLASLVRNHLLLPEVATRRDIGDAATIRSVATAVKGVEQLGLLVALTEADARSTGPTAWTDWKAGLVRTLVERVGATLTGTDASFFTRAFPTDDQLRLLESGTTTVRGDGRTLTVVAPDRPGLFWRVAGALVLAGLNVVSAEVTSPGEMALEEFTVTPAFATGELSETFEIDWLQVAGGVERALAGRVAIGARVAARATTYRRRLRSADAEVRVRFEDIGDDASGGESVIEVDAPDGVGVLFAITHALAELDVDIRYARVETQTDRVIDAFSIVDAAGDPVMDADFRAEIERAIRYALSN
jgi:[protein-PII] uridylyltransferase